MNNVLKTSLILILLSISFQSMAAKKWQCTASCNVQVIEGAGAVNPPDRVTGSGTGSSEPQACVTAKRDATQKAPRGTYARHCQCKCKK